MPSLSLTKKIVFSLIPTLLLLFTAEVLLRWSGAAERCPSYKDNVLWVCDPILYFKSNPHQIIDGKPLNSAGFRGPEFAPHRAGVKRVLTLGDSCTYGVISPDQNNGLVIQPEPYPQLLQHFADERFGAGRVEVLNGSVPGYNTYQGIMLLRTKLRDLNPDIITVRFGWNDLAMSKEQAIGHAFEESDSRIVRAGEDLLLRTALYPFALRLGMELRSRLPQDSSATAADGAHDWRPNVPLEQFARNLRRIVELGRSQGAEVWLITSPDPFSTDEDFRRYEADAPTSSAQLMLALDHIPSFRRLAEIHAQYNQVVRAVAAETGAVLIDMAAIYRNYPSDVVFSQGDVIHPTEAGHRVEAEELLRHLG